MKHAVQIKPYSLACMWCIDHFNDQHEIQFYCQCYYLSNHFLNPALVKRRRKKSQEVGPARLTAEVKDDLDCDQPKSCISQWALAHFLWCIIRKSIGICGHILKDMHKILYLRQSTPFSHCTVIKAEYKVKSLVLFSVHSSIIYKSKDLLSKNKVFIEKQITKYCCPPELLAGTLIMMREML